MAGGYMVAYYRMNKAKDDLTGFRQVIGLYSRENMNLVFNIKKGGSRHGKRYGGYSLRTTLPGPGRAYLCIQETDNRSVLLDLYDHVYQKERVRGTDHGGNDDGLRDPQTLAQAAADKIQ